MKQTNRFEESSFHGTTFKASVMQLRALLGEPQSECNDGRDKTNFDWFMETGDGRYFTVYDWKYYRSLNENETVEWHIGGKGKQATDDAKAEILSALRNNGTGGIR